ncbi:hypothetical protein HAP94_08365 [Acidithiobacillus ferrivorans]|nr:hypothetical protein [Acidithiobacillus ferrivorans]
MKASISISEVLSHAGIGYRPGRWLRLKGPDLDAISVNAESGAFKDHRTGEHGSFHALCARLGIDSGGIVIDAAAIFHGKTDQEKADNDSIQWAKTQWARGIPAIQQKRPGGWAQAAWDADQSQYNDMREAVYDYLMSRGLDPVQFLPLIRIQTQLNPRYKEDGEPDNVDAEMQKCGADFAFLMPMYLIGKAEKPEHISGVQRTFLKLAEDKYSSVQKIGRMMLGKKGVTTLAASGSPVILPESDHAVLGAGEGFETVASFVQTMHRPGVVCWDWSGLQAWSELLRPGEGAPLVAFLVDDDKSETGQRESAAAARKIISHEHGRAVYLLPPESIAPDAKGNRDWNDLLKQSPDSFAAEIIHSWHKSDENLALAPISEVGPAIQQKGPQDAETAQAIAEAVAQHLAYAVMEKAMANYLVAFHEYTEKLKEWQKMPKDERKEEKLKRPKLPPLLIKVTTGVGKSHIMREILQNFSEKIPMLILTRTHELAQPYIDAGAFGYHGRSNPEPGKDFKASDCFKYPIIELVAENNHVPALTACRQCEHGRKFVLENYHEKSVPYMDAKDWFYTNHVLPDNVPACLWLSHQAAASHVRAVVGPNASYSDTLAHQQTPEKTLERLVIVDEIPDLARHIEATSSDMGLYASKCLDAAAYLSKRTAEDAEEQEALDKIIADNQAALELFQRIGAWLGRSVGKKGIQSIPDEMVKLVKELHVDWLPGATARWEKAEVRYGHEPFVPLRMMKGLVESIATGTTIVEAGVIHVHEITTLGDRIKKGLPTILLDATPSPAVEYMVQQKGGQIVDAIAKQHVKIVHYNQYLHGRTWKNKAHQQSELESLLTLKGQMQEETGNVPVTLTYMPHCELAERTEDPEWGYFGRDDVGQDNWKGRYMLIFGGPLFSPTTQALSYNSELMLKRLAGDKSSPDWNPEVARGVDVTVGNKVITSKAPLPSDPYLRTWVLDNYARRIVQGIGRARAVWATEDRPINIWIAGGLPLAGLAAHGLEVAEYREEKRNKNDSKADATQEKTQAAIATLQSADKNPSYRAVNDWLLKNGQQQVRYEAWKLAVSKVSTTPYISSYEVVDGLLEALGSIADAAMWNGVHIADAANDLYTHPMTDQNTRAAAELILCRVAGGVG